MSLNVATGEVIYDGDTVQIQGTPSMETTQNITIEAQGTTAGGSTVSVSKIYTVIITDPTSYPFRMDLTLSGYTGSSTLTDFPVLVSLSTSISGFSYNGFLDPDGDGVPTGSDLRFFASSGKELAYEIADWNPSIKLQANEITGLDLWLDASDTTSGNISHNSNAVSQWSDKSGKGNHATQSNSSYRPALNNSVLNALPVIRFDGSDDVMTLSGNHTFQTFFLVLNARDGNNFGAWDWPMGGWTGSSNKKHVIFAKAGYNSIKGENASINGGTPNSEFINFSPLLEHKIVKVSFNSPATRSDWKIGDGDDHWNGDIAEILAYSGTLSTFQIQKIEGYLAHKWGLTNSLPNNHPFKTYAPEKASQVWVKVPSISRTTTVITAAWGKAGTETTPDYATNDPVWSNGYEGVWHLDTISSGKTNDSSPQGIHLTVNGGATTTAGQTGSGISLDGTDDDLEALGYKGISGGAQRSMQLWIKTTANAKAIMHWGKDDNFKRWTFRTTDSGLRLRTEITGGGRESNSAIGNNVWTHISATFPMNANNLNDIKFYVNGTQSEETSGSTSMPNTSVFDNLLIGNDNSNRRLPGIVDEVRLSSVERYADWIKAEYDNQKSSQSLVSYGSVTDLAPSPPPSLQRYLWQFISLYSYRHPTPRIFPSRVFYGLPQGLDFNDNGQITGTPEVSGQFGLFGC